MNLNSDFNLFAYKDSNTCKKVLVKVHYNSLIVDLIHAIEGAYQYHKDGK